MLDEADDVSGAMADAWRTMSGTSLFTYADGESTATFTDRAFPYADVQVEDLPQDRRDAAGRVCSTGGVTDATALRNCILDVAVSGDPDLGSDALTAQAVAGAGGDVPIPPGLIAASAAGDPWTDGTDRGTAVLTYGHRGCSAVDANGICTGGIWPVLDGAQTVWRTRLIEPGKTRATFTKTFTATAAQASRPVSFLIWADDSISVELNGMPVPAASFPQTTPITLRPGENVLAVTVENRGDADPVDNPAGLAWSIIDRFTVPATANLFAAGRAAVPELPGGGGTLPPSIAVIPGVPVFVSAAGQVSCHDGDSPARPDGGTCAGGSTDINTLGTIAGLTDDSATQFLAGVFTTDDPATTPAPDRLAFSSTTRPPGHDFDALAPRLNQTFFIGDGLKEGSGAIRVPQVGLSDFRCNEVRQLISWWCSV